MPKALTPMQMIVIGRAFEEAMRRNRKLTEIAFDQPGPFSFPFGGDLLSALFGGGMAATRATLSARWDPDPELQFYDKAALDAAVLDAQRLNLQRLAEARSEGHAAGRREFESEMEVRLAEARAEGVAEGARIALASMTRDAFTRLDRLKHEGIGTLLEEEAPPPTPSDGDQFVGGQDIPAGTFHEKEAGTAEHEATDGPLDGDDSNLDGDAAQPGPDATNNDGTFSQRLTGSYGSTSFDVVATFGDDTITVVGTINGRSVDLTITDPE